MLRKTICLVIFMLLCISAALPAVAAENYKADTVTLKLNDTNALVDGAAHKMGAVPRTIDGITMIPLRFIAEIFGAQINWDTGTNEITIKQEDNTICLEPGSDKAVINGKSRAITGKTLVENDTTLVPMRFLAESMNYKVDFVPATKEIKIKQLPPPNKPPVASFNFSEDTVAQGETVIYEDNSYDPDGDQIVEKKWTGNERAFFAAGEYEVTLAVKDSRGAWSTPYTKVIKVTDEVKMDRLAYNFHHPIAGEPLGNIDISVLDMKQIEPAVSMTQDHVMISNSPEVVRSDGILYSDTLSGENRLYYHHINGSNERKKVYLLAVNQGLEPVKLTLKRWSAAGPGDPMGVGRAAAYRLLAFDPRNVRFWELQPGEIAVLNEEVNNICKPGEAIHGMFNVESNDDLLYAVVAVGGENPLTFTDLDHLPAQVGNDNHIRGTFKMANRDISVQIEGTEPERLVIADGEDDGFLGGTDNGLFSKNSGNYGVVYHISVKTKQPVGVVFSPRGGVFAGAAKWDGKAFNLPNKGALRPQTEFALIGVIEPGKAKVLEFIPPAGSYLPVNLIFIPIEPIEDNNSEK